MSKKEYTLIELLNELITAEGVLAPITQALVADQNAPLAPRGRKRRHSKK